ncbi:MAG: PDZ domain-containing protein [Planctomycetota bacterium]
MTRPTGSLSPRRTAQRVRAIVASLGLACTSPMAHAQSFNAALWDRLVGQLNSETLSERDAATDALVRLDGLTLLQVERTLRDQTLTPEQRARLERVGEHAFAASPRAAMGVGFARLRNDAVQITEPHEGFDAFNKLRVNDLIIEAGGEPIEGQEGFRIAIVSRDPGQVLPLVVEREGKLIEVDVVLGSLANLRNAPVSSTLLRNAWAARVERMRERQTGVRTIDTTGRLEPVETGNAAESGPPLVAAGDGRRLLPGGAAASADPDPTTRRRTSGIPLIPPAPEGETIEQAIVRVQGTLDQQNASLAALEMNLERTRNALAGNADDEAQLARVRRIERTYIEYREELRLARSRTERMLLDLREAAARADEGNPDDGP